MTLKELLEARQKVFTRQTELNQLAATENRSLTDSEETEYQNLETEYERLDGLIERQTELEDREAENREAIESAEARANASQGTAAARQAGASSGSENTTDEPPSADERRQAVDAYLRFGYQRLSERARSIIGGPVELSDVESRAIVNTLVGAGMLESRAQSVGTTTAGGHTVPDDQMMALVEAQAAWGGMFNSGATILDTATGRQIPIPTDDDTSNSGALLTENTEVDEQDVTFGQKVLDAYTYTSKLIRVSRQLLEDSSIDVAAYIGRKFGRRLGTAQNAHLTTGTGSAQPNGLITAATSGKTAASATAFTYLEMLDLKYSVDPAYQVGGRWGFHNAIKKEIKKLLDGDSRPIFQPDVQSGRVDRIDGDPFYINQDMSSAMTTGQKVMVYGDHSPYYIRRVNGVLVLRLEERFAEFNQVGFVAFQRLDGELMDAGTNPVKYMELG
ncbi:MAG: phage major capsid protein [Gemmatimonadetes bacterium]|nr:phage major capsid protein [Gemmatimonadota bacterium]